MKHDISRLLATLIALTANGVFAIETGDYRRLFSQIALEGPSLTGHSVAPQVRSAALAYVVTPNIGRWSFRGGLTYQFAKDSVVTLRVTRTSVMLKLRFDF